MTLDEIQKLCDETTPGPWIYSNLEDHKMESEIFPILSEHMGYFNTAACTFADWKFIAASRTLMPKLLEVAEAAAKVLLYSQVVGLEKDYANSKEQLLKAIQDVVDL